MWNYRIYKDSDGHYMIIEVYYKNGNITAYTDHVLPSGENIDDLMNDLKAMIDAFQNPVLTIDDLPKEAVYD